MASNEEVIKNINALMEEAWERVLTLPSESYMFGKLTGRLEAFQRVLDMLEPPKRKYPCKHNCLRNISAEASLPAGEDVGCTCPDIEDVENADCEGCVHFDPDINFSPFLIVDEED